MAYTLSMPFIFNKRFFGLFWTQFFGAFVDNFYKSFLLVWIVYHTNETTRIDPEILISIASGLFILPFFLFSNLAGELAAKYEKSKLIRMTKWFEVFLVLMAILAFWLYSIPWMISILFLLGTQGAFFGPMKYSILPQLMLPDELLKANGWIEMGTFLAILLGTLLGSLVLSFEHHFYYFALFMVISTLTGLVFSYTISSTTSENPSQVIHSNFLVRTFVQMKLMKQDRRMFLMIQMISWFWFLGIIILTIIPIIGKDILHKGEKTVSILMTCMSLCIGLGSITCHWFAKKIKPLLLSAISCSFVTLSLLLLSYADSLQEFLILLSVLSFFCGLYAVPLYTFLQKEPSVFLKSHLIAMLNIFNAIWMVGASIGLGVFLKHSSISMLFIVLGFSSLIQNLFFWWKVNHQIKE